MRSKLLTMFGGKAAPVLVTDGMWAWWPLLADWNDAYSTNNLTAAASTADPVIGASGGEFDGNDRATIADAPDYSSGISFCCYVNPTSLGLVHNVAWSVSDGGALKGSLGIKNDGAIISYNGGIAATSTETSFSGETGNWHTIGMSSVDNETNTVLYFDGLALTSTGIAHPNGTLDGSTLGSRLYGSASFSLTGIIRNAVVYEKALSAAEQLQNHQYFLVNP